jgi:hypothetical protein
VGSTGTLFEHHLYLEAYDRGLPDLNLSADQLCKILRKEGAPDPKWLRACTAHILGNKDYIRAVKNYKEDSVNMNKIIKDPKAEIDVGDRAEYAKWDKDYQLAIASAPANTKKFTVFRGISDKQDFLRNVKDGIYTLQGFASTSHSLVTALSFAGLENSPSGEGMLLLIQVPVGASALFVGGIDEEEEAESQISLNHRTRFKVINYEPGQEWGFERFGVGCEKGNVDTVTIEQLPPTAR